MRVVSQTVSHMKVYYHASRSLGMLVGIATLFDKCDLSMQYARDNIKGFG